jgi:hypothetical protein
MKRLCTFLFILLILTSSQVCADENYGLDVTPGGWDYGNVLVGTSAIARFDLESLGPSPVWVYYTFLNETPDDVPPLATPLEGEYTLGAFSFDPLSYPIFPRESAVGEHNLVDVIFTPPSPGHYSVFLGIISNDYTPPPGPQAFFLLGGNGIDATVPEPSTMLLLGSGLVGLWGARRKLKK